MENELPKRKRLRLSEFDYSTPGMYFVTICTQNRRCLLSRIVGGDVPDAPNEFSNVGRDVLDAPQVELLPHGKIAEKYIQRLNDFYDHISVEQYVIMPNHIHAILFVLEDGASRTSPPTSKQHASVPQFVSTFKRFCNKESDENLWQRGFHDHIIRNEKDYDEHIKYIYENPIRWKLDELYSEE